MSGSAPRTLAEQLRGWSDAELARLLTDRPDLGVPAPQDTAQLASRAGTRASVLRALDQLTTLELTVLEAVLCCGPAGTVAAVQRLVHAHPGAVATALARLRQLALVWGGDDELRVLSVVPDVLGAVTGLGAGLEQLLGGYGPARVADVARALGLTPTGDRQTDVAAVAAHLGRPENVRRLLDQVGDPGRAVVEHLDREGRDGAVASTEPPPADAEDVPPVGRLLLRGLLVARDRTHVALPREVAVALRGGRTTRDPVDAVPALATAGRDHALVDRAAAGAAFELVRHVELLLEHWGTEPPTALRTGGLGVRDLRAAAELLHVEERVAALHVELAAAAGLLAVGPTDEVDAAWLPTDAFDAWSAGSVADRWVRLALAWLETPRLVGLVGGRLNGKPVNALAPDLERSWLPETRRAALDELASLPDGEVLAAGTGVPSLVTRLRWLRPRRPAARAEAVAWCLEEASVVGVLALGGLARHGRTLLGAEDPAHAAAAALEPLLPEPVDHMLLQADLTAVAPGPLAHELAHHLATMADIESRGGATVYRFTERSVRRAFDAGWSAREVHDFLAGASRTPVPQPLVYLVDDVARTFGTLRAGAAESFLRSDDETALAELVHHPKAASLRLRRIAPTVVVSDVPLDVLLPRLRELGAAPVVEAPDGTVRLARRDVHRARSPRARPKAAEPLVPQAPSEPRAAARFAARVSSTVAALRAGDRAALGRPADGSGGGRTTPASALATLREAVEAQHPVWIGYVDNHGSTVERVVDPVKVEGGWLTAYDHRSEEVRSFAVHRITGVRALTS
ncbi:MAG TPA: helicase C-terminal domain-containing protein [Nocardioides sp.]|nr:helicase C-terminal domain-containing protein [Nocardioides sp.]